MQITTLREGGQFLYTPLGYHNSLISGDYGTP